MDRPRDERDTCEKGDFTKMDDKGEIISSADVDETLSLQIWTKGRAPRLVIANKAKGSRKLIQLGWTEKRDRKLSIGGAKRGQSTSYAMEDLAPTVRSILDEYCVRTNFKIRMWKFAASLERMIHVPEIVTDKGELNLLSEEKRSALWISDCTGADRKQGAFRPFFPATGPEAEVLSEERLRITEGARGIDALTKTGVIRDLQKAAPERWLDPLRIMAAAMLLSFSYCDADGSETADALWEMDKDDALTLRDPRLAGLGRKLTAFIRHFDIARQTDVWTTLDEAKELQDKGYERKRRMDFQAGTIGDVPYRVTLFEHEGEGRVAMGCEPQSATSRHTGSLVYDMPMDLYRASLKADTMGGPEDEFFSATQLAWAKQFKDWSENVTVYVRSFAGLMRS